MHGPSERPAEVPVDDPVRAGCGAVRSVLDALVRTILSQNTSGANSTRAMRGLRAAFRFSSLASVPAPDSSKDSETSEAEEGKEAKEAKEVKEGMDGRDWPFWERIRVAKHAEVADAIRSGGLADTKARVIQAILNKTVAERGVCSLDHLHDMDDRQAMATLMAFDGVGPKTASCVLLFSLSRDSFALDVGFLYHSPFSAYLFSQTHIWRLTKALAWVPQTASREDAQAHLDLKIPNELKYRPSVIFSLRRRKLNDAALHVLLIKHGKVCPNCKAGAKVARSTDCPLSSYKNPRGSKVKMEEGDEAEGQDLNVVKTEVADDPELTAMEEESKPDIKEEDSKSQVKEEPKQIDSETSQRVKREVAEVVKKEQME